MNKKRRKRWEQACKALYDLHERGEQNLVLGEIVALHPGLSTIDDPARRRTPKGRLKVVAFRNGLVVCKAIEDDAYALNPEAGEEQKQGLYVATSRAFIKEDEFETITMKYGFTI